MVAFGHVYGMVLTPSKTEMAGRACIPAAGVGAAGAGAAARPSLGDHATTARRHRRRRHRGLGSATSLAGCLNVHRLPAELRGCASAATHAGASERRHLQRSLASFQSVETATTRQ